MLLLLPSLLLLFASVVDVDGAFVFDELLLLPPWDEDLLEEAAAAA